MYILKKLSLLVFFSLLFFNACSSDLIKAAKNGDINAVAKLLQQDVNPNTQDNLGNTPLIEAAWSGYTEIVRLLLEKGASPNLQNEEDNIPLLGAALGGYTEIVRLLLEKGANPNLQNRSGYIPLREAATNGHIDTVRLLLEKGANPNIQNKSGNTPLFGPVWNGYAEIVKLLLEKGANPNLPNNYGKTPLDIARKRRRTEIVGLIENAIALDAVLAGTATHEQEESIRKLITAGADQDLLNMIAGRTSKYIELNGFLKSKTALLLLGEYIQNNQQGYTTDIYRRVASALYNLAREIVKKYIVLSKESNFSSLPEEILVKILIESYGLPESFLFTTIRTKSGNPETFEDILKDYIAKIQSSHEQAAAQPQAGSSNISEMSTKRLKHKQAAAQSQAGPSTEEMEE